MIMEISFGFVVCVGNEISKNVTLFFCESGVSIKNVMIEKSSALTFFSRMTQLLENCSQ